MSNIRTSIDGKCGGSRYIRKVGVLTNEHFITGHICIERVVGGCIVSRAAMRKLCLGRLSDNKNGGQ